MKGKTVHHQSQMSCYFNSKNHNFHNDIYESIEDPLRRFYERAYGPPTKGSSGALLLAANRAIETPAFAETVGRQSGYVPRVSSGPDKCRVSTITRDDLTGSEVYVECLDDQGQAVCAHELGLDKKGRLRVKRGPKETPIQAKEGEEVRRFGDLYPGFVDQYKFNRVCTETEDRKDFPEDCQFRNSFIETLRNTRGNSQPYERSFTGGLQRAFFNSVGARTIAMRSGGVDMPIGVSEIVLDKLVQNFWANVTDPFFIVWLSLLLSANGRLMDRLMDIAFTEFGTQSAGELEMTMITSVMIAIAEEMPRGLEGLLTEFGFTLMPGYMHDEQFLVPMLASGGRSHLIPNVVGYLTAYSVRFRHKFMEICHDKGITEHSINVKAFVQGNFLGGTRTQIDVPVHFNAVHLKKFIEKPVTQKDKVYIRASLNQSTGPLASTFRTGSLLMDLEAFLVPIVETVHGLTDLPCKSLQSDVGDTAMKILYLAREDSNLAGLTESVETQSIRLFSAVMYAERTFASLTVLSIAAQTEAFAATAILTASRGEPRQSGFTRLYQNAHKIQKLLRCGPTLQSVSCSNVIIQNLLEPFQSISGALVASSDEFGNELHTLSLVHRRSLNWMLRAPQKRSANTLSNLRKRILPLFQTKLHHILDASQGTEQQRRRSSST